MASVKMNILDNLPFLIRETINKAEKESWPSLRFSQEETYLIINEMIEKHGFVNHWCYCYNPAYGNKFFFENPRDLFEMKLKYHAIADDL